MIKKFENSATTMFCIVILFVLLQVACCQNVITTIAGAGTGSYSGDGGAATSAALGAPTDVALDSSGRILFNSFVVFLRSIS